MSGGLVELFASSDNNNSANANACLWGPLPETVYTAASHEIINVPLVNGMVTVPRNADLIGETWCQVTLAEPFPMGADPFDLIEEITYEIGGTIIERYCGRALKMLSLFDVRARPSYSINRTVIVFPLRLCTSANTHLYLPLICLRYHEVRIGVKVKVVSNPIKSEVACNPVKSELLISYIFLDTKERRDICNSMNDVPHALQITQKMCIIKKRDNAEEKLTIPLASLGGKVRDIIVLANPDQSDLVSMRILARATGSDTWHERQRPIDSSMCGGAIQRHFYGITETNNAMYFFPFDHMPLNDVPTGGMNLSRSEAKLELTFQTSKTSKTSSDVCILIRSANVMRLTCGMASLDHQAPKSADT